MKKMLLFALCMSAVATAGAQKQVVANAKKLVGKSDKIEEARSLIQQAIANPETANDVETYYVAGKIEFDALDKLDAIKMINPNDSRLDPMEMGKEAISGYKYYMQALPLDSVPNEKGQVKAKYSKDMIANINNHSEAYFEAGANFFNNRKYYPEAYEAFMIYGDLPGHAFASKAVKAIPDSVRATAYFNAGLAGYSGNQVEKSAEAFKKARNAGYTQPESYIYEIACWQNIANSDSTRVAEAKDAIMEAAMAGYKKFGIAQPLFVNNMVNSMVADGELEKSIELINTLIGENPDNAGLYGLRGYVYDRMDNDDASEADYRKAASLPDVDFETLKNVSKKLFRLGTQKYNVIEGSSPEAVQARQDVKNNYFLPAKEITERAKAMNANDSDLQYVIENIDYALETFFQ